MAKLLVIMMLLVTGAVLAQDDDTDQQQPQDETRRPSWSSGLPERRIVEPIEAPKLKVDMDDMKMDMSEFGLEKPKVEFNFPKENLQQSETDVESQSEPVVELPTEEVLIDSSEDSEAAVVEIVPEVIIEPEPEPEPELVPEPPVVIPPPVYKWVVTERAPVDFPAIAARRQLSGWVDVEVTLNPQGDVVASEAVDYSADGRVFIDAAENNVSQWRFQPPREQGVNELVSNVYRLEFTPPPPTSTVVEDTVVVEPEETPVIGVTNSTYMWIITEQQPLDYPMAAFRKRQEGWVDLMVTINPDGEVINIEEERYSSRGKVFVDPAIKSMEKWQFEPPKNQGITEPVSRSYRIDFTL